MTTGTTETSSEAEVRDVLENWAAEVRAKDVDGIMSHYAPDIVSFDAFVQLRFKGAEAYKAHWQSCLEMCEGPMLFGIHELDVAAGGDVAFAHYLVHCGGTNKDGKEESGWMRATSCFRRIGGDWRIVHEHHSAPFDMASGKALLELTPERE